MESYYLYLTPEQPEKQKHLGLSKHFNFAFWPVLLFLIFVFHNSLNARIPKRANDASRPKNITVTFDKTFAFLCVFI